MLQTYSLRHNLDVDAFLFAYLAVMNAIIGDIWSTFAWKEWQKPAMKQERLFPHYRKDKVFKQAYRETGIF
jgi:hypothetical protein